MAPKSKAAGYSGTPLAKKLGIAAGWTVALVRAPAALEEWIGDLPEGARLTRRPHGKSDMVLWFVLSKSELAKGIRKTSVAFTERSGLWIAWPKKSSGVATDLTEDVVRDAGLAAGLVDFKVCAIDATWSGLRFARRQTS